MIMKIVRIDNKIAPVLHQPPSPVAKIKPLFQNLVCCLRRPHFKTSHGSSILGPHMYPL